MSDETQEYHEVEEVSSNPVTEVIEQALVKANITDAVIAKLKNDYGGLKINGLEDRDGYRAVVEARKECKTWRVLAQKICKNGRAEALQIQKAWVKKETEIAEKIGEVENYLQEQEDEYNSEKERIKREEQERQQARAMKRTSELSKMGAIFDGVNFVLGEVSVEGAIVREVDDEMYNNDVLPQFKEVFEHNERLRREREEEERKEKERIEAERKRLHELEEKERREKEEKERQEKEALQKRYDERADQLAELTFIFQKRDNRYKAYHVLVDDKSVMHSTPEEWDSFIAHATAEIATAKETAERQRAEEEKQRAEAEAKRTLGSIRKSQVSALDYDGVLVADHLAELSEERFNEFLQNCKTDFERKQREKWEREEKARKEKEEQERQEQENKKADTAKWNNYVSAILAVPVPECRGTFYRKKVVALRSLVDQIKAL